MPSSRALVPAAVAAVAVVVGLIVLAMKRGGKKASGTTQPAAAAARSGRGLEVDELSNATSTERVALLAKFNTAHAEADDDEFVDELGESNKRALVTFLVGRLGDEVEEEERVASLTTLRMLAREQEGATQLHDPDTVKLILGCTRPNLPAAVVVEAVKLCVNTVVVSGGSVRPFMLEAGVFNRCHELMETTKLTVQERGYCCRLFDFLVRVEDIVSDSACSNERTLECFSSVFAEATGQDLAAAETQSAISDVCVALATVTGNLRRAWKGANDHPNNRERKLASRLFTTLLPLMQPVLIHKAIPLDTKLEALCILLYLPPDVPVEKFVGEGNPRSVLGAVYDVLDKVIGRSPIALQTPLLGVITTIVTVFPTTREVFHQLIFPPEECGPDVEQHLPEDDQNMRPSIALPKGSVRARLVDSMTHPDQGVRFSACDIVHKICDENPTEVIRVAGLGKAANLLVSKGLFSAVPS